MEFKRVSTGTMLMTLFRTDLEQRVNPKVSGGLLILVVSWEAGDTSPSCPPGHCQKTVF